VELDRSLLAKWVGHAATLLQPLVEALRRHVMAATKLHADDTPVPVLAPGNGKTKTGRLWVYVRDDRTSADMTPPAVWFTYTPDRKGIHPQQHLESFSGTLQADAYGGYRAIYETGRVIEAACWAHARRQFYELHAARPNALNTEALERIGVLYKIEETIRGKPPDERRAYRQVHARPLLEHFHAWLTTTLETLSRKSDTSRAILYALNRWEAFTRYCDDGQLEIDNLPVERALRGVAMGRSLCTSFRDLDKHWDLTFSVVATRAIFARQRRRNRVAAQIARANLPRSIGHHLLGGKNSIVYQTPDHVVGDAEQFRRVGHRQPFSIFLS